MDTGSHISHTPLGCESVSTATPSILVQEEKKEDEAARQRMYQRRCRVRQRERLQMILCGASPEIIHRLIAEGWPASILANEKKELSCDRSAPYFCLLGNLLYSEAL